MIDPELLKKIQRIHIHTNRLVTDSLAGEYVSAFRGRGMEFEEVREYQQGDDIRDIDWNVTARSGHPYVKLYREERELTIILLIDVSSSGYFGTIYKSKNEVAAEIAAFLAFAAIKSNDKVGLIIFSDSIEKYIPPKKGRGHVWRVIKEVLAYQENMNIKHKKTNIAHALEYMSKVIRRRAVCFLISDFLSPTYERALRIVRQKHDLIGIAVLDPRERDLPAIGFIELEDAETGETIIIDTYDANIRQGFSNLGAKESKERKELFHSMNLDYLEVCISPDEHSYIDPLVKLFRIREKRL